MTSNATSTVSKAASNPRPSQAQVPSRPNSSVNKDRLQTKLYTVKEISSILGISLATTYNQIHANVIPSTRIGKTIRVPGAYVLGIFQNQAVPASEPEPAKPDPEREALLKLKGMIEQLLAGK